MKIMHSKRVSYFAVIVFSILSLVITSGVFLTEPSLVNAVTTQPSSNPCPAGSNYDEIVIPSNTSSGVTYIVPSSKPAGQYYVSIYSPTGQSNSFYSNYTWWNWPTQPTTGSRRVHGGNFNLIKNTVATFGSNGRVNNATIVFGGLPIDTPPGSGNVQTQTANNARYITNTVSLAPGDFLNFVVEAIKTTSNTHGSFQMNVGSVHARVCQVPQVVQIYQCSDNLDNDGDGAMDYPSDFSCNSATDNDETNPRSRCQDGFDNDGDGFIDYPQDIGCGSNQDNSEFNIIQTACNTNSDCGTNSYVGSNFCQVNSVFRNFTTYTCNNPGTANAYCSSSTTAQLQQACTSGQTCSNEACSTQNIVCSTNSDCGTNSYVGSPFCQANSVYRNLTTYTCNNPGTSTSYCSNTSQSQLQQTCTGNQTCSNGSCANQNIACSTNSDCGSNSYTSGPFCQSNNVYRSLTTYTCNNPGTSNSYCSNAMQTQLQQTCSYGQTCNNGSCSTQSQLQCSDGFDNDGDGFIDYPQDIGCSSNQDNSEFNIIQTACNTNSDCGSNSYIGSPFCQVNSVFRNFTTYTCNNPGTANAYCSSSTVSQLQQTCTSGQVCSGNGCITNVVNTTIINSYSLHYKTKCYNNNIHWYDSKGVVQDIYQNCSDNNNCTVDNCTDGNNCQHILKCDESTCAAGSADYTRYCSTLAVTCVINTTPGSNSPNNDNTLTAALSNNPLTKFLGGWFLWLVIALILIFLFIIIFRSLSYRA